MIDLLFPVAAVGATFLLIIPALTLVSRAVLRRKRRRTKSWTAFGSETTFAWLTAPTLLPVLWLMSSALHQSEPTQAQANCLIPHVQATTCWDALLLLGLLVGGMMTAVGMRAWRERPQMALEFLGPEAPHVRRLAGLTASERQLKNLRVRVARHSSEPVFTVGWFRPMVVLDACFVHDVDDDMIRAALLHEVAHISGRDTLRGFIARLCLGVNPAGRLLVGDFDRWHHAREAQCDSEAVHRGCEPLALAEGIVRAAKFRCAGLTQTAFASLCGHHGATLKLRLALLLDGPSRPVKTLGHVALLAAVVVAIAVPHVPGAGLLEHFHFEVERLLHSLL